MKVFSIPGKQTGKFIKPTDDGGILLFSYGHEASNDLQTLVVSKTNATGVIQWQEVHKDDIHSGYFTPLRNGNTLLTAAEGKGNLFSFNAEGKLIFKNNFYVSANYGYSQALQIENSTAMNGFYLVASCNGPWGGTSNYIWKLKPDGSFHGRIDLKNDIDIKGKVLNFKVYGYEDPNVYYIVGQHFPKSNWSWNDVNQTFVAKIQYDAQLRSTKTVTLDPGNMNYFAPGFSVGSHFSYADNSLLIGVNQYYWANSKQRTHFFKVDSDLNLVWEKDLIVENTEQCAVHSLVPCRDGNLLLSGWVVMSKQKVRQPFICKIDHKANVIWKRIFDTPLGGSANYATELPEGNIAITGETNSFGVGIDEADVFLIKTNSTGDLE